MSIRLSQGTLTSRQHQLPRPEPDGQPTESSQLERAGRDADKAKGLLVVYEGTQEINFTVRDILRRQQKQALKEHSTKKPKRPKKPAKPAKN
jgi:hypothetical protein